MILPKNEKVKRDGTQNIKIWIYGTPNIGKTTFANQFPDALMINTDGNYKYIDSPVISLVDNNKDPWEVFIEVIDTILKGEHTYKTIVIDLLEDVYQYARNYYCKKLKIDHESELGFAKGYDIIRNNFLIALRKLASAPYNIVFISHEETEVVKDRIGRETTVYKTALPDKLAKKISGMVEITGRISATANVDENGNPVDKRVLQLSSNKEQYGGNKIPTIKADNIELSYENLVKAIKGIDLTEKK